MVTRVGPEMADGFELTAMACYECRFAKKTLALVAKSKLATLGDVEKLTHPALAKIWILKELGKLADEKFEALQGANELGDLIERWTSTLPESPRRERALRHVRQWLAEVSLAVGEMG